MRPALALTTVLLAVAALSAIPASADAHTSAHYAGLPPTVRGVAEWLAAPVATAPEVDAARSAAAAYWARVPGVPSLAERCGGPPVVRVVDTTRALHEAGVEEPAAAWAFACSPMDRSVWLEAWWVETWDDPDDDPIARGRAYYVSIAHEYGHALDVGGDGDDHAFPDPDGLMAGSDACGPECAAAFPAAPTEPGAAAPLTVGQARAAARRRLARPARWRLRVRARSSTRVSIVATHRRAGSRLVLVVTRPASGGPVRVSSRT